LPLVVFGFEVVCDLSAVLSFSAVRVRSSPLIRS
jgi:hypothetical protein